MALQIDVYGVLTVEFKSDPPVSRNGNRKLSLPITNERMKLAAWQVHVPRLSPCIQPDQHPFDGRSMLSGHALVATPRKKLPLTAPGHFACSWFSSVHIQVDKRDVKACGLVENTRSGVFHGLDRRGIENQVLKRQGLSPKDISACPFRGGSFRTHPRQSSNQSIELIPFWPTNLMTAGARVGDRKANP